MKITHIQHTSAANAFFKKAYKPHICILFTRNLLNLIMKEEVKMEFEMFQEKLKYLYALTLLWTFGILF